MAEKIYISKTLIKPTKFDGLFFSANAESLIQQIRENTNEKGYFNMIISKRKEPGQYGDTHYATVAQQQG